MSAHIGGLRKSVDTVVEFDRSEELSGDMCPVCYRKCSQKLQYINVIETMFLPGCGIVLESWPSLRVVITLATCVCRTEFSMPRTPVLYSAPEQNHDRAGRLLDVLIFECNRLHTK
jgi:hypothetical protein